MPQWLQGSVKSEVDVPLVVLVMRLTLALVLGCVVAGVYRWTCAKPSARSSSLMATLVLLTVLIGMVTMVIGNSVARAFSLVGALSIVRFRTVVEDTRDTAFVIFAVAVGMAIGVGYLTITLIGIPLTALAAFLFRSREDSPVTNGLDHRLTVRVSLGHDPELLLSGLKNHVDHWTLLSASTVRQGAALNLTYSVHLHSDELALPLVLELNRLEGVQEVTLNRA